MQRCVAGLVLAAGLTATTSSAFAPPVAPPVATEDSPAPPATATDALPSEASLPLADSLYRRAKDLMAEGRYAEACEDFAESNRIDQATGGTLLNLAVCHERIGRVATACAEFEQARALARYYKRPDREQFASQHVALLRPRISTLSITVRTEADGEKVQLDGVVLARVAWQNLPVDPGEHALSVTAPGKVPWATTVRVAADREARTLEVPALVDAAPAVAPPPPPGLLAPSSEGPAPESRVPARRIAAFALGAAGLASAGVGAAFGVTAVSENSTSEHDCPNGRCTPAGAKDSQYALTNANVANVCVGVGIVAVGVATVLLLTSSRRESGKLTAFEATLVRHASLGIGGVW